MRSWHALPLVVVGLLACGPTDPPDTVCVDATLAPDDAPDACLIVGTNDHTSAGGVTVVDTRSGCAWLDVTATWHDALLHADTHGLWVINREGGDNLQRLDPEQRYATTSQRSVGNGTNPWDLATTDTRGFVARYNTGDIAVVDLDDTAEAVIDTLALDPEAEPDGRAEPGALWIHDDTLYVLIQGLGAYPTCAGQRGRLLAFNVDTLAPSPVFDGEARLPLAFCNPGAWGWLDDDRVVIGSPGEFRSLTTDPDEVANDGGIELINLRTGVSEGVILSEHDFGGRDLLDLAVGDDGRLWIVLADEDFGNTVHGIALWAADTTDRLGPAVWRGEGIFDVQETGGVLWIADRSPEINGLVALDAATGVSLDVILPTGLPPYTLVAIDGPPGCHMP